MQRSSWFQSFLVLPLAVASLACDAANDDDTGCGRSARLTTPTQGCIQQPPLDIAGTWIETPGDAEHVIDESTWTQTYPGGTPARFHIDEYENADGADPGYVIAESDAANEFNAGKWNKFVFVFAARALYYCTAVFDADSADAALTSDNPDESDLETGCGGFPWGRLDPKD